MSDIAIRVDNLGKQYRIGGRQEGYQTFRESLMDALQSPFRRLGALLEGRNGQPQDPQETIWALKDVSFEIRQGEVVGIIGRNGAGKSTLLKILSRITEPTTGRAEILGRVGSLLEVGTGFHPELTGRENIFLNGAILGMRKAEIARRFDEIVAFSEVEKFIDTPVKHYSSGMYLRLAFAVAAHLDPEILLVDEVLAVGDAAFQKKCLGKMGDVAKEGRTVLFVSHNMAAIQRLCHRCLWLQNGEMGLDGPSDEVVISYLNSVSAKFTKVELPGDSNKPMRLRKVRVAGQVSENGEPIEMSEHVNIIIEYDVNRPVSSSHVACFIHTIEGICILGTGDVDTNSDGLGMRGEGRYKACVQIPPNLLGEGTYTITVTMGIPYVVAYDRHEAIIQFQVIDSSSNRRKFQHTRRPGILGLELPWSTEKMS
jgi:lipopolysaccharide transport system ATP-binding protein